MKTIVCPRCNVQQFLTSSTFCNSGKCRAFQMFKEDVTALEFELANGVKRDYGYHDDPHLICPKCDKSNSIYAKDCVYCDAQLRTNKKAKPAEMFQEMIPIASVTKKPVKYIICPKCEHRTLYGKTKCGNLGCNWGFMQYYPGVKAAFTCPLCKSTTGYDKIKRKWYNSFTFNECICKTCNGRFKLK